MFNRAIFTLGAVFLLGACSDATQGVQPAPGSDQSDVAIRPIAAELMSQSWSFEGELFGYFLPQDDVSIGSIHLDHIGISSQSEARAFINGDPDSWPPVALHFDDVSSPTGVNELGATYYETTYLFQPERFLVTDHEFQFRGHHDVLGEIRFQGQWDRAQIEDMMAGNPQNAPAALRGDLMIGDVVYTDLEFQGWLGD